MGSGRGAEDDFWLRQGAGNFRALPPRATSMSHVPQARDHGNRIGLTYDWVGSRGREIIM